MPEKARFAATQLPAYEVNRTSFAPWRTSDNRHDAPVFVANAGIRLNCTSDKAEAVPLQRAVSQKSDVIYSLDRVHLSLHRPLQLSTCD